MICKKKEENEKCMKGGKEFKAKMTIKSQHIE
jgi:hypothetical protein